MKKPITLRLGILALGACAASAWALAATAPIRYCCTPQQVAACQATGGTTTCRTGVCQCQF
jgi:hypothetical protein